MTRWSSRQAGSPGLYVHVPFCAAICPYCDFAVTRGGAQRRRRFVDLLAREIDLASEAGGWGRFDTIYLGGGTPSMLTGEQLASILSALRRHFAIQEDCWITLEANPEDASPDAMGEWRQLGVRTLSLGVQSFDDRRLEFLGRKHRGAAARRAVETGIGFGFEIVSVDLIYGQPGQTLGAWEKDLEQTVALGPEHVSCYQLTVHEGTRFGRQRSLGVLREKEDPELGDFFATTHDRLSDGGYEGYEVSNFARAPEFRSRHNQKYWRHVPYLGLGPSAHSWDGRVRWWNERSLAGWEAALAGGRRPVAGHEELGAESQVLEAVMLGLRTREGVDLAALHRRFGIDLRALNGRLLDRWLRAGLLEADGAWLRPTRAGLAVADSLPRRLELSPPPVAPG